MVGLGGNNKTGPNNKTRCLGPMYMFFFSLFFFIYYTNDLLITDKITMVGQREKRKDRAQMTLTCCLGLTYLFIYIVRW